MGLATLFNLLSHSHQFTITDLDLLVFGAQVMLFLVYLSISWLLCYGAPRSFVACGIDRIITDTIPWPWLRSGNYEVITPRFGVDMRQCRRSYSCIVADVGAPFGW